MYNGLDNVESHVDGDDEQSMDGMCSNNPANQEATSDQELSADEVASNNNETPELNHNEEGYEEKEHDNTDALTDFFKLLPYLYLVQRNSSNSQAIPDLAEQSPSDDFATNQLYESQRLKSLLHLESLRSQIQASSLRYVFGNLQQFMPSSSSTSNGFHEFNNDGGTVSNVENDHEFNTSMTHDEPLDLTQKNKVGRIETKGRDDKLLRPNPRSERGYTIQDLEAALDDIKSGKLGTRRAAVIYGIPRSTLRNKVYKMGKSHSKTIECQQASQEKIQERECNFRDRNGNTSRSSYTITNSLPNVCDKLLVGGLGNVEVDDGCEVDEASGGVSRLEKESMRQKLYLDNASNGLLRIENSSSNEGVSGETEGQQTSFMNGRNQLSMNIGGKGYSQRVRHDSTSSLPLHNYPCVQGPGTSYDGMYGDSSLGKKSRPKRGKYRNYDRDALAKAVQAVQNGEMSVHRAGSFFGVPHSTLEYKVKERHLLRQAKSKGKTTAKTSSKSIQPTAGCSSVTSLSPTALADSNDSSTFQRAMPDLQRSLSHYLNVDRSFMNTRWNTPLELLGLGLRDPDREFVGITGTKKEIDDPSPKTYDDPNETCENNSNDLLDLTKKMRMIFVHQTVKSLNTHDVVTNWNLLAD